MRVIVVQNPLSSDIPSGTIILWYGTKANIPSGWTYYDAAAKKLIAGALSASTTALGTEDHNHSYAGKTGAAGAHPGHTISISQGQPINETIPGIFSGGTKNANLADRYHANHPLSVSVSAAPDHDHTLSATGNSKNLPPSVGLYFIRKT